MTAASHKRSILQPPRAPRRTEPPDRSRRYGTHCSALDHSAWPARSRRSHGCRLLISERANSRAVETQVLPLSRLQLHTLPTQRTSSGLLTPAAAGAAFWRRSTEDTYPSSLGKSDSSHQTSPGIAFPLTERASHK